MLRRIVGRWFANGEREEPLPVFHVEFHELVDFGFDIIDLPLDLYDAGRQAHLTRVDVLRFGPLLAEYLIQPVRKPRQIMATQFNENQACNK